MLIMFRTKNFASFKDDVVLDLRKTSYKQHPSHTFKINEHELLKTVAIYGANASGKSNLIRAIYEFKKLIISQFYMDLESSKNIEISNSSVEITPFLLADKIDDNVEFEIVFYHKDRMFQYGYTIEKSLIISEWLLVDNKEVFERENENIIFGSEYKEILKHYTKYREDRLYISTLDYFITEDKIKSIIDALKEYIIEKLDIYKEIILETSIKSDINMFMLRPNIIKNDKFKVKISEYIRQIDVGIEEIIIEKEKLKLSNMKEEKEVEVAKTVHPIYDENGKKIGKKVFDIYQESSGTVRFLSYIQYIVELIEDGGVFIVDELSSRLHPLLTKFIVDIFQSDLNKSNAQLIFTTHEVSIMNNNQFRRDEVAIVDKDVAGRSTLYTLSDLQIREDATFNKDYFKGKYGGIPIISDVLLER